MNRRQFIATAFVSGGLAGCVQLQSTDPPADSSNDSQHTPTATMTDASTTDVNRYIELTNVEPAADDVPASIGINVTNPEINAERVGTIKIGFVFTESGMFKTGAEPPVGKTLSSENTPGLVLLTPEEGDHIDRISAKKWKPDRPQDQDWGFPASRSVIDVADQALLTIELEVWQDHQYDGYLEPGDYRFTD